MQFNSAKSFDSLVDYTLFLFFSIIIYNVLLPIFMEFIFCLEFSTIGDQKQVLANLRMLWTSPGRLVYLGTSFQNVLARNLYYGVITCSCITRRQIGLRIRTIDISEMFWCFFEKVCCTPDPQLTGESPAFLDVKGIFDMLIS